MARTRHEREERFLKAVIPWLSRQLGDELVWLGRPENPDYVSKCRGAKSLRCPVDAEFGGERLRVAMEHTTLDSFPEQRRFGALFDELRDKIRSLKSLTPSGNNLVVGLSLGSISGGLTRNDVRRMIPDVVDRLRIYLEGLPANPSQDDIVRGYLLEEPVEWRFGPFNVTVRRSWISHGSHIRFALEVDDSQWQHGVRDCLVCALRAKLGDKAESFEAYGRDGWFVALVLQISDLQLSSTDVAGERFRQIAPQFKLDSVNGIAFVDQIDDSDKTPECCWAYLQGEVRTARQQYVEVCECLGIELNP